MGTGNSTAPLLVAEVSCSDKASQSGGDDSLKEIQESKRKTAKENDFGDDVVTKKRTLSSDDMEEHFAIRDQLLCRLAETMDSIELKVLREKEQNFRTLATKLLSQTKDKKQTTQDKDTTETKETTSPAPLVETLNETRSEAVKSMAKSTGNKDASHTQRTSMLVALYRQMMFEIQYAIPALVTLTLDCVAHVATYAFFSTIVGECSKFFEDDDDDDDDGDILENDEIAYVLTFLLGIIIVRVTGGLWIWVSEDTMEEIDDRGRFTMLRWFRKHDDIVQALAMVCFYLCIIPVGYVYNNHFSMLFLNSRSAALNGLPRAQGKTFLGRSKGGINNAYPLVVPNLSEADDEYLWKRLTVESYELLLGDADAPLVTPTGAILGATLVGILSIYLLKKRDFKFWEME